MKFEVVKREVFEKTDGPVQRGRGTPEETLELLDKLRKLPGDSLLLVEIAKGENVDKVRGRLYARACAIKKKFKPGFVIRFALSQDKRNVIIWKELPAQNGAR